MRTCIEEADKLGMKAYLYDENNWPSGPVDGELIEKYPEYRNSVCVLTGRWSVAGGRKIKQKLDVRDGLIAVVAVPVERGVLSGLPHSAVLLDDFVTTGDGVRIERERKSETRTPTGKPRKRRSGRCSRLRGSSSRRARSSAATSTR